MTKITFYKKNEIFLGFKVEGHTEKDEYGKDLLCCQLSTVAQLAAVGVKQVAKLKCECKIRDGFVKILLKKEDALVEKIQMLFETCFLSFQSIIIDEEKYVKLEVENV